MHLAFELGQKNFTADPDPPSSQRWLIGEDIPVINDPTLGIFRDMWRPDRFADPSSGGFP